MITKTSSLYFLIILFLFVHCRQNTPDDKRIPEEAHVEDTRYPFDYAKTIALEDHAETIDYIIKLDANHKRTQIPKDILPLQNMVVLSSSSIGFLSELNQLSSVKAVYGAQWMYNPTLHELIDEGKTVDEGNIGGLNLEKILSLDPDAVIAYSDPNQAKIYKSLEDAGILVIYVDEYLEETPLGKAEFIKLFGVLTGNYDKAEAIFQEVESNYTVLKKLATEAKSRPTVFAEVMRGDIWYMPGGKSFPAQYMQDASADYLWANDEHKGSFQLNFEQVFAKAGEADIWLNAGDLQTRQQLIDMYSHHDWFQAYKSGQVYSIRNRYNHTGANDYFETGTVRADWVLKDLIKICHPELLPEHQLYFYHQLN